jgi:hypothetical protein
MDTADAIARLFPTLVFENTTVAVKKGEKKREKKRKKKERKAQLKRTLLARGALRSLEH